MSKERLDLDAVDAFLEQFPLEDELDWEVDEHPLRRAPSPSQWVLHTGESPTAAATRHRRVRPRRRPRDEWARPSDLPAMAVPPGYRRDRRGTWRYELGGDAVPGARDITLDSLWPFGRRSPVVVPDAAVRVAPELGWCRRCGDADDAVQRGGTAVLVWVVDELDWDERAEWPLGLDAPELAPQRLVDVDGLATALSVAPSTVTSYLARGQLPAPQARIGGRPAWSRAVLSRWWMRRPVVDRAARSRVSDRS
jgi:hypothetical protein